MRYRKFPKIETIDDVLPAVRGRDEFVVAPRSWGTVIDYQITLPDSFPCPVTDSWHSPSQYQYMVRRECRGLKFDQQGRILARPFHKFFNLGERPETTDHELSSDGRFHEDFVIMPKLDGSMVHPILWNDSVYFCTRMGITSVADQAEEYAKTFGRKNGSEFWGTLTEGPWYMDFCYDLAKSGMTPIFEWCSRNQRIVLDYPEDSLTLTAIRNNVTGEYLTRGKMQALAVPYRIPMVDLYDGDWNGIEQFSQHVRDIENAEGYVLRWDDGNMVKMKGEWYVAIHRAKDSIAHEKRVIGLILNDDLDDVLPHLLPTDYERLVRYREDFWAHLGECATTLYEVTSVFLKFHVRDMGWDKKEAKATFAKGTVAAYKNHLAPWKGLMFQAYDCEDCYRDIMIGYLRKRFALDVPESKANGTQKDVDELRAARMLPEKRWEDY